MSAADSDDAPLWPPVLDRFVVVLVEPQLWLNVGTVVRAIKNMGLTRLRLVAPPLPIDADAIERTAHRSQDLVDAIEVFDTLDEALADCHRAIGLTARARSREWPTGEPRERVPALIERARHGQQIALVFGRERTGLSNEELERCDEFLTIRTRRDYASLNLAQAVLLVSHELLVAAGDAPELGTVHDPDDQLATKGQLARVLAQMLFTLEAIGFFKSSARAGVEHALARIVARARLDGREARLLTGVFVEVLKFALRVRRGIEPPPLPGSAVPLEIDAAVRALLDELELADD